MRVLFWGTAAFAIPALRALIEEGFEVVGVVTQPDRPAGRSRSRLVAPPVKDAALAENAGGITVRQPERPRGEQFLSEIDRLRPDLSVVTAYGHILPAEVITLPPLGTINIHASLLPKLRGASPIQAAIREGYTETGVTIMRMVPALDAGPIILQARTPIAEDETFGELELRLSELGALALIEALTLIRMGKAVERPQDDAAATYAGKIDRGMARIAWHQDSTRVARLIRAYDPQPGAWTTLRGSEVKLFGASVSDLPRGDSGVPPGQVLAIDDRGMLVACGAGAVKVAQVQPAGKRRLAVPEWARGRAVRLRDRLGE
jgi:methionyl-tRNA formyltransferase